MDEEPLSEVGDDPREAWRRPCWVEFVQVPQEAADDAGSLGDEVLAVVDQEADLAFDALEPGNEQICLAQGGTGDRECVDRI